MPLPKVLLIEDDSTTQELWRMRLKLRAQVLQAYCLSQAEELIAQHPDISVFVFDGTIGEVKDEITLNLIGEVALRFPQAQLVAVSSDYEMRGAQLSCGCQHERSKNYLPKLVTALLTEMESNPA